MTAYNEQPDIMAIGDSMYQGIRSLSLLPAMMPLSAPKQVAVQLGMAMTVPDLKQPLLFDMEAELRRGGLLHLVEHIRGVCLENLKAWPENQPWSEHEAFDNIAVGGAEIASLTDDTDARYRGQAAQLRTKLADPDLPLGELASTIGKLWYAMNNCYTLNPRHRDIQSGKSPLDQVADRQPRILLINIGSNEGLFMAGFAGDFSDTALKNVAAIPAKLKPIAERLSKLPERVERIVFNSLIRPRVIPNLMPSPQHENEFPGDGYYDAYGPRIGSTQQLISGAQLRDFDKLIAQVNAEAQDVLKTAIGNRVVFADIYASCQQFDGKHYRDRGLTIPGNGKTLTNKPLTPVPFGYFGGIAGIDNMHPTAPGYGTIADVVLDMLGRRSVHTDKAADFAADTLLTNVRGLPLLVAEMELSLIGALGVFRGGAATPPSAAAPMT